MKHRIDAQPPLTLKKCRRIDEEALGNRYVCKLYSLFDLSAMCVASHLPFEYVETTLVNIPDPVQERILYYSFPRDNADIKTYSSFTNCGKLSSEKSPYGIGEHLFLTNCVENVIQIGFHLTGVVKTNVGAWMPVECKSFKVSMTFDRCKITSISCTCNNRGLSWCPHAVALALFRISKPNSVDYRSPISDTLVRMDRSQLQKFAQYLIASHPNRVLASAQQLADRLLQQDSTMNKTSGAPDPTAGAAIQDTSTWFLDEAGVREQLRLDLAAVAACAASPTGTANSATVAASVTSPMDFYTLSNFGPGMFRASSTANTSDHPVGPSSRLNNSSDEGPPATGRAAAPTTGARSEAMSTTRPSRPFARVWLENYRQLQKSMPVWSSCSSSASSSLSWPMTASRWATAVGQSPAAMQAGAGLSTATTTTTLGSPASTPMAGSSGTALSVYSPGGQVAMIFAKACELLSTRDANGPRLLAIITEELINCARLSLPKLRRSFRGVVATTDRNAWESTSDATTPELEDLDATDVADLDAAAAAPPPRYFAQQQSEGAATTANSSQPPPAWTIPLWEEATRLWTCFLLSPGTSESSRQKWRSRLLAWSQSPRSPRDETYLVPQLTTPPAVEQLTSSVVPTQSPLLRPPSSCLSANQRPARNHSVFKLAIEAGSLPLQKGLWLLSGANPCTGVRAQLSPNALSDLSLSMPSNVQQCTCPFCGVSLLLSKTWCLNETFVALCLRVSSLASTGYREEATNLAVSLSVLLLDCVEEVSRRRTMPGAARIWQPPEEGAEAMASAQWSRLYSAPCSPPAYAPPGLANLRSPSAGKGGSPCSLSVNTSCANAGPTGPGWYHSTSPLPGPSGGAAALPLPPSRTPPTFKSPPPPISPGCFGGSSRYGRGVSSGFSFGDGGGAQWQSVPGAPFIHPPPPLYPPPPPPPPHPRYHAYPNANFESAQTAPGEAGLRSPIIGPLRRGPVGVGCLPFTVPRPPSRSPLPPPPASRYPNRSPSVSDPLSETFLSSLLFSEASTNCPSHECGWLGLPGRPIISLVECLFEAAAVRLQQEEEEVEEMGEKDESEGHEVESERTKQNATSGSSRNIHNETLSAVDYIHLALKVGIVALCQQRRLPTSSGLLLACQAQETRLLLLLDTVPRNATTAHAVGQLVCQLMGPPSNLSPPSSSSARSPTPSASASSAAVAAAATTSAASTNCGLDLWWWSALGSVVHPDSYPIHVVAEFLFGHLLAGETAGAGTGELAYLVAARSMRLPMLEPFSDSLALNSGIGQNRQNDRSGSSPAIPTAISTMPGRPSNLYSAPLLPTEQAAHFRFAGSVETTDIPSHHHHPPLPSVLAAAAFAGASGVVAPCYESPLRFRHPSTSAAAAAVGLQPPAPLLSAQQTADQAQHYPAGAPDLAQPPVAGGAATTDTYRRGLEALEAKQTRLAISLILASRSALHRMDHFMRLCDRHIHAALSLLTISREVFVEATGHRPSIESSSPFDALSLSVSAATAAAAAAAAAASTVPPPAPSPLGVLLPVFLLPSPLSPAASPPVLQERIHLVCAAFHLALNVARRTASRVHWRRREMLAWVVSTALLLGPSALLYLLNRWTLYMSPREAVNWLAPTLFACMALPGGEGAQLPLRSQLQQPITFQQQQQQQQQQRHHLTPAAAAATQSVARRHSSLLRPRYHHHHHSHRSGLMMRTASETALGTGYPAHGGASRSQYQLQQHHYVGLRDAAMAGSSQAVGANSGVGGGSGPRDYSTAPRIHSFLPYTPPHREQVVAAVRQMAMQAAAQDPVNCAMATLHLTEKDAAAFEAAYRLVLEAAEAGSLGPGLLFTLARYLDRRGCPLRAFPLAIHAMRLFSLSNLQESHPVAHDVLWACLLAHRIGPATLQEMLSYVVRNVHCPTLLADILHRCRIPPQSPHFQSALQRPRFSATAAAAAASRVADSDWVASDVRGSSGRNRGLSDPALLLAATPTCDQAACGLDKQQQQQFLLPVDLPPLKALLDATISAFVTTTNTRLANISPRQYAEFVEFLGRARDAFNLLKPDGPAQFRNLVGYLCHSYRGKRKLVALLNERFNS